MQDCPYDKDNPISGHPYMAIHLYIYIYISRASTIYGYHCIGNIPI